MWSSIIFFYKINLIIIHEIKSTKLWLQVVGVKSVYIA